MERLKPFFIFIPLPVVFFGLYFFKSALLTLVVYHLALLIILILHRKLYLFKLIFRGWHLFGLFLIGAALAIGGIPFLFWDSFFSGGVPFEIRLAEFGLTGGGWIFFCFYFVVINPILEEVFWRGYYCLDNRKEKFELLTISDIGFAFYHIPVLVLFMQPIWIIPLFLSLCLGAILLRFVSHRLKGLLIPISAHILADLSIILVTIIKRG